jgi:putative DNA primase/helicase
LQKDIRGFEEVTKMLKLLKVGEGKLKEALKKHGANNAVATTSKPSRSSPPTGGNANLSSPISWSSFPHTTQTGKPKATVENLDHLLKAYGITCYYDEMLKKQFVVFPNEAECKNDMSENGKIQHIRSLLTLNDIALSASDLLAVILMKNAVNPVLELITGKAWDGKSRLKKLFKTITVPKEDIKYRDKLLLTWLIQCVAAADGAVRSPIPHKIPKYELVLTLQGSQGTMKTSWFTALLPKNYAEYIIDGVHLNIDDKDTVKKAVSGWIVELGELDSTFRKSDVAQFKAFMSNRFDTIRLPYDRVASDFQRRTSFCASVNDSRFITDTTGARRLELSTGTDEVQLLRRGEQIE